MMNYAAKALVVLGCVGTARAGWCHDVEFVTEVINLTYMQPFSPILFVAHKKDISLFIPGEEASEPMATLAETGDVQPFLDLAASDEIMDYVCGYAVSDGITMPGYTSTMTYTISDHCDCDDVVASMATMLVNSNDAFTGFTHAPFPESMLTTPFAGPAPAYDAGSETNTEKCMDMPGPACADVPDNYRRTTSAEGYVHVHRGIHGVGDISAAKYDWRNPAAYISCYAKMH